MVQGFRQSVAPIEFIFTYKTPFVLHQDGQEGGPLSEGSILIADIRVLRDALLKVRTQSELAKWLNMASYVTPEKKRWTPKRISDALRDRFFRFRDILTEWLVRTPVEQLILDFPQELVNEVCWTSASSCAEEVFARATITTAGVVLPIYSPRQALILRTHVDLFWSGYKFRRCAKCGEPFSPSRDDQKFCDILCKRAAGSLRYYHRKNSSRVPRPTNDSQLPLSHS